MNEFTAVFTGFLIRMGIPILFTGGLVYLLGRLDARWQQNEIVQRQQGQKLETGQKLCREYKNCSVEQISICPATKSDQPCWQVFRKDNGYLAQKCLTCEVFRAAPVPIGW
jgi:hypothetical protein